MRHTYFVIEYLTKGADCVGKVPLLTIFTGTKAQFIKMAPIAMEFERRGWPYRIIDTGQHGKLVQHIIDQFHLRRPDLCLAPLEAGVSTLAGGLCTYRRRKCPGVSLLPGHTLPSPEDGAGAG